MHSKEIREKFLKFFEQKQHRRLRSSSLVPEGDPTLFFTNAGMVPFKNYFLGLETPPAPRATTSQKCMRVSGKHNDLENVGRTARHHTFFEMLGNFSFGDYFKKEAILFAWEFLTKEMKLDPSKLWITVFRDDDEAALLWEKEVGIDPKRIIRMGEEDNFWSMGAEGPCGPCSEIHFDHGSGSGCKKSDCAIGCSCDRFMEIWNLVFMQFNRDATGKMTPLPKPSVDTGMGLERLSAVVQGVHSNYESDLFTPLIHEIEKKVHVPYGQKEESDISIRVLADHIRAATFLIGDGVQPSNEGRGYVLRRILRRAIRHGRMLGMREPFFYKLSATVVREMGEAYPELKQNHDFIAKVIEAEEKRFLETLDNGLKIIQDQMEVQRTTSDKILHGDLVFKLYDTFGFPVDLTQNIAEESGFSIDWAGFEKQMEGQRESGRQAWKGSGQEKTSGVYQKLATEGIRCEFLGYKTLSASSEVLKILKEGKEVPEANAGDQVQLIAERTPFYGESGGQVGDAGIAFSKNIRIKIEDTQKPVNDLIVHIGKVIEGKIKTGDILQFEVDPKHRTPVRLNHTATHLLHAALRKILGDHVRQAGSLVEASRLRFDFSHFEPISDAQLQAIESLVNQKIREDLVVEKKETSYAEAIASGAMALFGEKYGEKVRVLKASDFSVELCGGTHVDRTGEIGFFKIMSESSVASGIRRIEAITGEAALFYCQKMERDLKNLALKLKVGVEDIPTRVERLAEQIKKLEKENEKIKAKSIAGGSKSEDLTSKIREKNGIKMLAVKSDLEDVKALRTFSDQVIQKIQPGIALVAAVVGGKATLIVRVSKELTSQYKAGELIAPLAKLIGGSGGGKPDMAQAGGEKIESLDEALNHFYDLIK